eukprot:7138611-Pyramimonas_sp.AAC.1
MREDQTHRAQFKETQLSSTQRRKSCHVRLSGPPLHVAPQTLISCAWDRSCASDIFNTAHHVMIPRNGFERRDGICGLEEGYPPGAHREEDDAGTGRSGATTSYVPGVIIDLLFSLFPVSPTRLFVVSGRRLLILMHFTEAAGGSGTERYCNVPAINEKPQIIQEYESGKAIPNNQILAKLERVLGCKLRGNLKK